MSHRPVPTLAHRHPLTGDLIRAVGFRRDGRPIFPVMGAAPDDPPEKPEDIPQDTWDALGDPGKAALSRERSARQQAERDRDSAVRERDAARARPTPPKNDPPKNDPPNPDDKPDIEAIVRQAVNAAIKPFQERDSQRDAEQAAGRVRDAVLEAAKPLLHDPSDALAKVDLTAVVDDQGRADAERVKKAIEQVVATSPHLAKSTSRVAPTGIGGGGAPSAGATEGERVKALLAQMQTSAGVRVPTTTN